MLQVIPNAPALTANAKSLRGTISSKTEKTTAARPAPAAMPQAMVAATELATAKVKSIFSPTPVERRVEEAVE